MGMKEDIQELCNLVNKYKTIMPESIEKEKILAASQRVEDWLESSYCPLVDEDELEEDDLDDSSM